MEMDLIRKLMDKIKTKLEQLELYDDPSGDKSV